MRNRRSVLKGIGAVSTVGVLAGCSGGSDGGGDGDSTPSDGGDTPSDGEADPTATAEQGPSVTFGGNKEVNFNLSPSVPQENLYVQYAPVRDYLEKYVTNNYDVPPALDAKMNIGSNYAAVLEALGQGTADIAETGPFAAAVGNITGKSEVILQRFGYGAWEYNSIIAVAPDSDISSVSDLAGKTIAYSDALSTSGFLYPTAQMKAAGVDIGNLPEGNGSAADFEPTFAGGHVKSYTLLKQGQVDAACMGAFVRDTPAGPASKDTFNQHATTLWESKGIPRAPIVVSPELGEEAKEALQQAFLEAPDRIYYGADGKEGGDDDLWFNKVRESGIDRYQPVIDKAETLGIDASFFA